MLIWIVGIFSSLGLVGAIAAVIAVPSIAIPILQRIAGAVLKCRACMALLAAVALLFIGALYGVHVEGARCEGRMEKMRLAAEAARKNRDDAVAADLKQMFGPKIAGLELLNAGLTKQRDDYETRKPVAKTGAARGTSCKLGDAAGLLRAPTPR